MTGKWNKDGVTLPDGTELRMAYKGQEQYGVIKYGSGCINGKIYDSPTKAAQILATDIKSINGRLWWDVKRPADDKWIALRWLDHQKTS